METETIRAFLNSIKACEYVKVLTPIGVKVNFTVLTPATKVEIERIRDFFERENIESFYRSGALYETHDGLFWESDHIRVFLAINN